VENFPGATIAKKIVSMTFISEPQILKKHVEYLANIQPPRSYSHPKGMQKAAQYVIDEFKKGGLHPEEQKFQVDGTTYKNISVLIGPPKGRRFVIGAHYDVAGDQPGADDNASGIAGILELARVLAPRQLQLSHPVELVAYALEEPPDFGSPQMGSYHHAKSLREKNIEVEVMIALEMIGYYSEEKGSQNYPLSAMKLFYPSKGHFISLVGRNGEKEILNRIASIFRKYSKIPLETLASPFMMTGLDLSDHSNYWTFDFPAVMMTDTAFMRNPNYHTLQDTPETLNYEKMAEVVRGLYAAILDY
jgi:hypothetical protein